MNSLSQLAAAPQQEQAQPEAQQQEGFNGTVSVMGQPVNVVNGIAEYDGEQFFVSHGGEMVIDKERNIIGYVENGEFKPVDEAHLETLRAKGVLEE